MSITSSECAQWVEALATLLAVLVALGIALFQDKMRAWIMRPKLDISIEMTPPYCLKIQLKHSDSEGKPIVTADSYYLRLRVANKGSQKAESVEVFAAKLSKQQADGSFREIPSFLPMNLIWADFGDPQETFIPIISPNMYRHCNLAHIIDPNKRAEFLGENKQWSNITLERTILSFGTVVKPHTLSYLQPFGKYRLDIIVAADNAKPVEKTVEISLTGDWYDEEDKMFSDGVGVKIL